MQRLSSSAQYANALAALGRLKQALGVTEDLKAIALYLFHSADCEAPNTLFPFVGVAGDPRDAAIAQAYETEWRRLTAGEYDDDEEEFLR
jgi:hypothetical protein